MSLFLDQSSRYAAALDTFDPLRGEWLMRLVDPWPSSRGDGRPAWLRIALTLAVAWLPLLVLSAVPSVLAGGQFRGGPGALTADYGNFTLAAHVVLLLVLIPIARRTMGDLINELTRRGITGPELLGFTPGQQPSRALRVLERITRLDGWRGGTWFLALIAWHFVVYWVFVGDLKPTWHTSPATAGSLFHLAARGAEQPNLAGLWNFAVFSPLAGYLILPAVRLIVVFACLCAAIASQPALRILPWHPDATGGLHPVGQTALLLSCFSFVVGVSLAGITIQESIYEAMRQAEGGGAGANTRIQLGLWVLYLLVGSLLFFLPLTPLRRRMALAKRAYLLQADAQRLQLADRHAEALDRREFEADFLQGLGALNELTEKAMAMAVWPFDRQTFVRYTGLLATPLAPLVADRLPAVLDWLKAYLEVGAR